MPLRASNSRMGIVMPVGRARVSTGGGRAHSLDGVLVMSRVGYAYGVAESGWVKTRTELCPPKPKELLMATRTCWRLALLGV